MKMRDGCGENLMERKVGEMFWLGLILGLVVGGAASWAGGAVYWRRQRKKDQKAFEEREILRWMSKTH